MVEMASTTVKAAISASPFLWMNSPVHRQVHARETQELANAFWKILAACLAWGLMYAVLKRC